MSGYTLRYDAPSSAQTVYLDVPMHHKFTTLQPHSDVMVFGHDPV